MRCLAGADTGRNASYRLDGSAASDAAVAAEAWLVARRVGADVATFWSSVSEIGSDGAERLNCSLTCGVGVMAGPSHLARPMEEQTVAFLTSFFGPLKKIFGYADACMLVFVLGTVVGVLRVFVTVKTGRRIPRRHARKYPHLMPY